MNEFVQSSSIGVDLFRRTMSASADVAEAAADLAKDVALDEESLGIHSVGPAVCAAAMCCYYASKAEISTDSDPAVCLEMAVKTALRSFRCMDDTDNDFATADYERLVKLFGIQDSIVLGDPFDPSESGPLGPWVK